jgi:hypothetical protein
MMQICVANKMMRQNSTIYLTTPTMTDVSWGASVSTHDPEDTTNAWRHRAPVEDNRAEIRTVVVVASPMVSEAVSTTSRVVVVLSVSLVVASRCRKHPTTEDTMMTSPGRLQS